MEGDSNVQNEGCQRHASGVLLECEGLTRRYERTNRKRWFGSRRPAGTVEALRDVSLQVAQGERVGIAGPSGSGKSTLIHLLAGLDEPSDGSVTIAGKNLTGRSTSERTRLRLTQIGIVFQQFRLLPSLSAQMNVALPLLELGVRKRERRRRAADVLERVGLGERLAHRPEGLSGGERQRVAIARALVTDPSVVLADEPTGELDSETTSRVLKVLSAVSDERAVVLASHDSQALDATDRIVRLRDGQVVERDA